MASQLEIQVTGFRLPQLVDPQDFAVSELVVDEGGLALSGATVTAFDQENEVASTTTDASGAWTLALPSGAYRLEFRLEPRIPVVLQGVVVLPEAVVGLRQVILPLSNSQDADRDGIPDLSDPDADNDGVINDEDVAPLDPTRGADSDGDGVADELDDDADGDGLSNLEEVTEGIDGWITNPNRADTDGDGVRDDLDVCPTVPDPDQALGPNGGEACSGTSLGAASLTAVVPSIGAPGDVVTVQGTGFPSSINEVAVRFGAIGAAVRPMVSSPGEIVVTIPEQSETGTVTVYLPQGALRAPEPFCFDPPPTIDNLSFVGPNRGGSRVVIIGQGLSAPACSPNPGTLALVVTSSTGALSQVTPSGPIDTLVYEGRIRQRAAFLLPADVASGPVQLSRGGLSSMSQDIEVQSGSLVIGALDPSELAPGDLLEISGTGFLLGGGFVTVGLPGSPPRIYSPISDSILRLTVPDTIEAGTLTLRVDEETFTTTQVTLRNQERIPEIFSFTPSILYGDRSNIIEFRGRNLDQVSSVTVPGVGRIGSISRSSAHLTFSTSRGVEPGPLRVEFEDGTVILTERVPVFSSESYLSSGLSGGIGLHPNGGLLVFYSDDTYAIHSRADFSLITPPERFPPTLPPSSLYFKPQKVFQPSNLEQAIVLSVTGDLGVLDIDTMLFVGDPCNLNQNSSTRVMFSPSNRFGFAFSFTGQLVQVDTATGRCTLFEHSAGSAALAVKSDTQVYVHNNNSEVFLVDVSTTPPTTTSFLRLALERSSPMVYAPDTARLFVQTTLGEVAMIDGTTGQILSVLPSSSLAGALTSDTGSQWRLGAHSAFNTATGQATSSGGNTSVTNTYPVPGGFEAWGYAGNGSLSRAFLRE